jgi:hypothetical protein
MPQLTVVTGVVSIVLGVVLAALAASHGSRIATALIPAYVGAIFVVLGLLARKENLRMHVMHVAALLALLLTLGSIGMGLPKLIKYYAGSLPPDAPVRPLAWWGQIILAAILGTFLVFTIRSFIAARRWRQQQQGFPVTPPPAA